MKQTSTTATSGMHSTVPTIYALVLNWNGYENTERCVLSLEKVAGAKLEIVIIDNGSDDGSGENLRKRFGRYRLINLETNGGYAAGNNVGIRYALSLGAELILLINNDVEVEPGFLEPMVNVLSGMDSVGAVTCKSYFASDKSRLYGTGGHISGIRCTGAGLKTSESDTEQAVDFISGCILLVKAKVFTDIGLFDERFFMYFEDLDFSRRVGKRFTMRYVPNAVVYHASGAGQRWTNYSPLYLYYNTRNRFLAFRNDPMIYRAYVLLYSIANCFAKTVVILLNGSSQVKPGRTSMMWRALWNGLFDGIMGREGKAHTSMRIQGPDKL